LEGAFDGDGLTGPENAAGNRNLFSINKISLRYYIDILVSTLWYLLQSPRDDRRRVKSKNRKSSDLNRRLRRRD
jgi:hypothetical protein